MELLKILKDVEILSVNGQVDIRKLTMSFFYIFVDISVEK